MEQNPRHNIKVTPYDKELAKDVLRLEVKLGYMQIKKSSTFTDYLDITTCYGMIRDKYQRFISKNPDLIFCSYSKAKEIIRETDKLKPNEKKLLLEYLRDKAQKNKTFCEGKEKANIKRLERIGIHWCLIPTKWKIDHLESPIKLLNDKITSIKP